ncbi:MAG: hypothetical protein JWR80_4976 [Bradyrhizobium sp.]|nr:hypothetical protein [Bradyrhizobium sp.]
MRTLPRSYRLVFQLPPSLVAPGGFTAILPGCNVNTMPMGQSGAHNLIITGPSREQVFEQASALLAGVAKVAPPTVITAVLESPDPRGRDGWTIIVGADVAFSPTSLPPHIPAFEHGPAERPPPALLLVANK